MQIDVYIVIAVFPTENLEPYDWENCEVKSQQYESREEAVEVCTVHRKIYGHYKAMIHHVSISAEISPYPRTW